MALLERPHRHILCCAGQYHASEVAQKSVFRGPVICSTPRPDECITKGAGMCKLPSLQFLSASLSQAARPPQRSA